MPQNRKQVRLRLQKAALELFQARGYEQTTAVEIAMRAGVTGRTFFRHFTDKREALFDGEAALGTLLTEVMRDTHRRSAPGPRCCAPFARRCPCRSPTARFPSRAAGSFASNPPF